MELYPKRHVLSPEKRGSRSPEAFRAAAEAVVKRLRPSAEEGRVDRPAKKKPSN